MKSFTKIITHPVVAFVLGYLIGSLVIVSGRL